MSAPRRAETDLARQAMKVLSDLGFDLYQEVPYGGRADIVGVLAGRTVCVCEVKASLSFDVIAQAKRWHGVAHWVFVAIPWIKLVSDGRRLARDICEQLGIGIIEIQEHSNKIVRYPRLERSARPEGLLKVIKPEHKTFAPAGSNGKFWSPWRDSVSRLVRAVCTQPGMTLKELIEGVPHHWGTNASAKGCIARQIQSGIIKELRLEVKDKQMRVYLAGGGK
jgi:hypothetical protein